MIRKLTGTVFRQLFVGFLFVSLALTSIIVLTQSLNFVEMIINKGASVGMLFQLIVLLVPKFLPVIFPITLFMVIMFFYSKLIADRELVVMSAAGLSPLQIAKPAIILALIVTLLTYAINIFLLPESFQIFSKLKWHIRHNISQVMLEEGTFNSVGNKTTVYIRERTEGNTLKGIFVHDETDLNAPVTIMAKRGSVVETSEGARIVMFEGSRQVLNKATNDYAVLFFDRYTLIMDSREETKESLRPDRKEMTLTELFEVGSHPYIEKRDHAKYIVEAHKRLTTPLASIAFTLIGLFCILSGGFTRRNQPRRVIVASAMVMFLQISILGIENASARNLALAPSMYLIMIIPIIVVAFLFVRPPKLKFLN
ncbi:MAG: LPS export ABC transporter permease LptF [Rhodospirillales bacterium]|nr:LPS export ABC transporter permease LptF [Rhodospirillales bacterium]